MVTSLGFAGRTEEALALYREALGAETVFLMRFRDSPDPSHTGPGMEDMIFHATFRIDGTEFTASDVGYVEGEGEAVFEGFALALKFGTLDRANRAFEALAVQGQIVIPLAESAFTSWYGIVKDRFGISWKVLADSDGD
ncbi:MAG: VOC family protein [Acidobacteriota bacterium]